MILIRLSSNKETFKTVEFNPSGLTLIIGREFDPESKDKTKTYNGVGKSLLIRLLHFCLGCNKIDEFRDKLPGWEFTLQFQIGDQQYTATRGTDQQEVISLNQDKTSLTEYKRLLQNLLFVNLPDSQVTFRSLMNRFMRPSKSSYNHAEEFLKDEKDFVQLINNAFLLGLDTNLILSKYNLRQEKIETEKKRDNFKKDDILKDFYSGNRDPEIELVDIEEKVLKLETSLKAFDVAENYHSVRAEADRASKDAADIANQIFLLRNSVLNIEKSLKIRSDLSKESVEKVYAEAKFIFKADVKKN